MGGTAVTDYEDLIADADQDYAAGRYKDAHITYGRAVSIGRDRNDYCRRMRGLCSRLIAEQRMAKAEEEPDFRQDYLNQAARWLAKSEANLSSAFDESPEAELGNIRMEQARTEDAIVRFMEMVGGDPQRRRSAAQAFRDEAVARLGSA